MAHVPTSIRIPQDINNELKQVAAEMQRTRTWIILDVLRQWFAYRKRPPTPVVPPRKRKAPPTE